MIEGVDERESLIEIALRVGRLGRDLIVRRAESRDYRLRVWRRCRIRSATGGRNRNCGHQRRCDDEYFRIYARAGIHCRVTSVCASLTNRPRFDQPHARRRVLLIFVRARYFAPISTRFDAIATRGAPTVSALLVERLTGAFFEPASGPGSTRMIAIMP